MSKGKIMFLPSIWGSIMILIPNLHFYDFTISFWIEATVYHRFQFPIRWNKQLKKGKHERDQTTQIAAAMSHGIHARKKYLFKFTIFCQKLEILTDLFKSIKNFLLKQQILWKSVVHGLMSQVMLKYKRDFDFFLYS